MIQLQQSAIAWGRPDFNQVLKQEVEQLNAQQLPLQQGLRQGSYSNADDFRVMVISSADTVDEIIAKVGIFFTSIIAGCSCADDPTPIDDINEYCVVRVVINKKTADTRIILLSE